MEIINEEKNKNFNKENCRDCYSSIDVCWNGCTNDRF